MSHLHRLSNYYVHPTCTPTRAALMTGRYAANVGLGVALVPGNPGGLEVVLLSVMLSAHSVPECGFEGLKTYQAPAHSWDLPR